MQFIIRPTFVVATTIALIFVASTGASANPAIPQPTTDSGCVWVNGVRICAGSQPSVPSPRSGCVLLDDKWVCAGDERRS